MDSNRIGDSRLGTVACGNENKDNVSVYHLQGKRCVYGNCTDIENAGKREGKVQNTFKHTRTHPYTHDLTHTTTHRHTNTHNGLADDTDPPFALAVTYSESRQAT